MQNKLSAVTLYLFRHGETEWSLSGQHTGRTDIPLTEHGREQARQLKNAVSKVHFDAVLVSPLSRARETAALAGLEAQATVCDDLAEFDYGSYEGLTTNQIREKVPDWTIWTHSCPGGETMEQAQNRCRNVIATAADTGGNVALVAHGHILRIVATAWLDLPASEGKLFMLDTTSMSILFHEHETPAVKLWNQPV